MTSDRTIDMSAFTVDKAASLVDRVFTVTIDGNDYRLKLVEAAPIEVRARRRASLPKRPPFSLYFLGPREPVLPQAMYTLVSDEATFESLFIVPIATDEEGTEYEAVFS